MHCYSLCLSPWKIWVRFIWNACVSSNTWHTWWLQSSRVKQLHIQGWVGQSAIGTLTTELAFPRELWLVKKEVWTPACFHSSCLYRRVRSCTLLPGTHTRTHTHSGEVEKVRTACHFLWQCWRSPRQMEEARVCAASECHWRQFRGKITRVAEKSLDYSSSLHIVKCTSHLKIEEERKKTSTHPGQSYS